MFPDVSPPDLSTGRTRPRISVVTPSFNQAAYLERTIHSILSQNYPDLEYVVIDGGSTDGSAEIIQKHSRRLAYWISEPDGGQADAINKGFRRATGDLVVWINSDDLLLPNALNIIAEAYGQHPDKILLGDVINFVDGQRIGSRVRQRDVSIENFISVWKIYDFWHQPGTFVPRNLLGEYPYLDCSMHFYFDGDWLCRLLEAGHQVHYIGEAVAAFRLHPQSKTVSQGPEWMDDTRLVCSRYQFHLSPRERDYMPAGLELIAAGYLLNPDYGSYWNRGAALQHLLLALKLSRQCLMRLQFWKMVIRLLSPGWFITFVANRLKASREAFPLPDSIS
jgi:glycosyltransferase involved in cell wall biosynthesis